MTRELLSRMSYDNLRRAYAAYNELQAVYEDVCGGPYKARVYKEYFAICDSRNNIRTEVANRSNTMSHGVGDQETKRDTDQ